jgi:hypothetical protein
VGTSARNCPFQRCPPLLSFPCVAAARGIPNSWMFGPRALPREVDNTFVARREWGRTVHASVSVRELCIIGSVSAPWNARICQLQASRACHNPPQPVLAASMVTLSPVYFFADPGAYSTPLPDRERAVPVAGTGSLGGARRSRAHQAERSAAELTSLRGAHRNESATCADTKYLI